MDIEIQDQVEISGDNRLETVVTGIHHKAYQVANLAMKDGPQTAAHKGMPLVNVYGALAF